MIHKRLGIWSALILLAGLAAFGNGQARAAQIYVDDDHTQCPNAQFSSIQAAVTAAHPGDTINVCPGTYNEQVRIDKRLTVQGISVANQNQAIIKPTGFTQTTTSLFSGAPIAYIVLADTTDKVTLTNLTVDGSTMNVNSCAPTVVGVYYRNASGTIDSLAVRHITQGQGFEGCQGGLGIFVQSGQGGQSKVDITNNSVHDYDKNGITANEVGTQVNIKGNAVTGAGPTPQTAQNGIQVGFGAIGTVDSNSVINHIYSQCASSSDPACGNGTSTNILVVDSDGVKVTRNNVGNSQDNIYYFGNKGEVSNNTVFQSLVFNGIDLVGDMNKANNNSIFNSAQDAVYVQGNKNEANGNMINEASVGVFVDTPSSDTHVNGNQFYNTFMNVVGVSGGHADVIGSQTINGGSRAVSPVHP